MTETEDLPKDRPNLVLFALLCFYLLLLVGVILFKLPFYSTAGDTARVVNLIPLAGSFDNEGDLIWGEIAYNTLLFVPFGIYLGMLTQWTFRGQVLVIAGLSLGFELAQYLFALGVTDVTDLIDNTLGGVVGIGIATVLIKLFGTAATRIVTVLASLLTVLVVVRFGHLYYLSHIIMGVPPGSSPG
ncbi:MAG: VanZ family protein [Propionibacteriaceae bacterium]|nr:VanZ family protein [Propionibacteriaceae bacterium]